jgi:predicted TIM-barrel fold metal-dependent hydrolase
MPACTNTESNADRVIDADGHVYERDEELFEYLEAPYAAKQTVLGFPFWPTLDGYHRGAIHARLDLHRRLESNAQLWIDFLDAAAIERTVLYPTAALTCGLIRDRDWAVVLARAYNTWLSERYLKVDPRLHGMALLPLQEPLEAAKELRRAVCELGMLGGVLTPIGQRLPLGHADFDPLYREAERLACPLAVHGGPAQGLGLDVLQHFAQVHALSHPFAQMIQMTSMVMSGVLDRFPSLRIAFLEAGISWLPFLLYRMDRSYEGRRHPEYIGGARDLPSSYLRRGNLFFNAEPKEDLLPYVIEQLGADGLLFTSDFPHEVNLAHCRSEIEWVRGRRDLSETVKVQILSANACRLYRLGSG